MFWAAPYRITVATWLFGQLTYMAYDKADIKHAYKAITLLQRHITVKPLI